MGKILHTLKTGGFEGAIYPVNPGHAVIQGLPAFALMAALTAPPDLALIAPPADSVPLIRTTISSRCHVAVGFGRDLRRLPANCCPNFLVQQRIVS